MRGMGCSLYDNTVWAVVYVTRFEYIQRVKQIWRLESVPCCFVVVERLPRDCRVELQVLGHQLVTNQEEDEELKLVPVKEYSGLLLVFVIAISSLYKE